MDNALILALVAAILGPLATYIVATRRLSGKISTSEATDLWAESANMRTALQSQLDAALQRVTNLETRAASAEQRSTELQQRNLFLDRQALTYEKTIHEQRVRIEHLEREVHDLQRLVRTLQEENA